jgi:hypothetical protein
VQQCQAVFLWQIRHVPSVFIGFVAMIFNFTSIFQKAHAVNGAQQLESVA